MKTLGLLLLLCGPAFAQDPITGTWHGEVDLKVMGQLAFEVTFEKGAEGWTATMRIPEQTKAELPLEKVTNEGGRVHFELPAGPGRATWSGALKDGVVTGTFKQNVIKGTFEMKPGKIAQGGFKPATPPTYGSEQVTVPAGEHTLAGTLTIPPGEGPFPAVVLITGSGAQTRDEVVAGFHVFGVLADHLSRNGVCVLRCDDRGTGESTGKFAGATTADFADDAEAAFAWLSNRPEAAPGRVGLVGHSEGGLIAPLVAARNPRVGFIVLLAGPAVNGMKVLREQARLILMADGAGEAALAAQAEIQDATFRAVRGESSWEDANQAMTDALEKAAAAGDPSAKQRLADLDTDLKAYRAQLDNPWMKHFLLHEPAPVLAKVKCPVLALFGEKDLQVPPAQSTAAMGQALEEAGNKDYTVTTIANANHLFQVATTGSPSEYGKLEPAFSPEFLKAVVSFLSKSR